MRPCDERKYLAWFDSLEEKEQDSTIVSLLICIIGGLPLTGLMGLVGISNTAPGPKINHNG